MKILSIIISIICRLLKFVSNRVTVSREAPIICAISSCVKDLSIRLIDDPFGDDFEPHSSKSFANLLLEVCDRDNNRARLVSSLSSSLNVITTA